MAQIFGTPGNDTINGTPGDDTIDGLAGDDQIYGSAGNDTLLGGAGSDVLQDNQGNDVFDGGEGNDTLLLSAGQYSSPVVNATGNDVALGGPGTDTLIVSGVGLAHTLYGGGGLDFFSFSSARGALPPASLVSLQVADFSMADGDRIILQTPLPRSWRGEAPAGFLAQLGDPLPAGGTPGTEVQVWTLQDAGTAVLYADTNGNALVDTLDLRVVFSGITALPRAVFGPGSFGTLVLTPGDDVAMGTPFDDLIMGNGGNDTIDGGEGLDVITTLDGNDLLRGGPGTDQLSAGNGINRIEGGDGDDYLLFDGNGASHTQAVGGAGSDNFYLSALGAGSEILDFQAGAGGDLLDVTELMRASPGAFDPFSPASGVLRLSWAPGLTQLQWDPTGAGDGAQWLTVASLPGLEAPMLVPGNITGAGFIAALNIVPANSAPVLQQPLPDWTVDEDAAVGFVVSNTTFSDNGPLRDLSFSATLADGSPLPAWLHFTGGEGLYNGNVPGIGQFSGTPLNADVGTLALRLTATDAQGLQASDSFTLTVRNTNDAPTVAQTPAPIVARAGSRLDWQLPPGTFVDVDAGDILALSVAAVGATGAFILPPWLQFDAASGRLYGMPAWTDAGTFNLQFKAFDTGGAAASVLVPLTVENPNRPPVAVNDSATLPANGSALLNVLANDSDPDAAQTLQIVSTTQPRYGSLYASAGSPTLSYTPLAQWNGSDSFSYTVSDGNGGSATAVVTLTVTAGIVGTAGADNLAGNAAANSIDAKAGNDTINAGDGDDFVRAGDGSDRVTAGDGNDTVLGGNDNDTIYGGNGGDVLAGGNGNDLLYGGSSSRGDGAADIFVFDVAPHATSNRDTLYGFEADGLDRIALDGTLFAALRGGSSSGVDADEFRAARSTQAVDANDFLLLDMRSNTLYYDADGNGPLAPIAFASFVGLTGVLDASDFTLVLPPGV